MKCPTDGAVLVMSERAGIEIDYCPECRGVWLDRGELDKIIEKAVAAEAPVTPAAAPQAESVAASYEREQAQRRDAYSGYDRPSSQSSYGQPSYGQSSYGQPSYGQSSSRDSRGYDKRYDKPKKRKHWLEELFD